MNPPGDLLDRVGAPVLSGLFILLLALEHRRPLRPATEAWWRRLLRNGAVALPAFVVMRLALIPVVVLVATWGEAHTFGVARWFGWRGVAGGVVAILVLDYTMYWWHRVNHVLPFFWRFHHVHHADLELTVSTAARFHFGEILLSVGARSLQVAVSGASPLAAMIYEVVLEASTEFHHSNLRLPAAVERALGWCIMTPRAHGIHHSVAGGEMNANYSNFLAVWDRLHGTRHADVSPSTIVIGVPDCRSLKEVGVMRLLAMPFRSKPPVRPPASHPGN